VTARHRLLVGGKDLLNRLLARPGTDDGDGDVLSWNPPRQPDQPLGEVENANRLAHVQREHFPAGRQGRCLQDELDGLLDAHEVAGHLRVGHRDRTARGDLAEEGGDDAARLPSTLPNRTAHRIE
jgi:hypothetical protein